MMHLCLRCPAVERIRRIAETVWRAPGSLGKRETRVLGSAARGGKKKRKLVSLRP
jgi:hypothetical protein